MKIALISCSKKKMSINCCAREMYSQSTLFRKALNYCLLRDYDAIFILSAKYGVLHPDEHIEPYEMALTSFPHKDVQKWAADCFNKLREMGVAQFDFYAGKIYYEELSKLLPHSVNVLKGMGIGERLKFLK